MYRAYLLSFVQCATGQCAAGVTGGSKSETPSFHWGHQRAISVKRYMPKCMATLHSHRVVPPAGCPLLGTKTFKKLIPEKQTYFYPSAAHRLTVGNLAKMVWCVDRNSLLWMCPIYCPVYRSPLRKSGNFHDYSQ